MKKKDKITHLILIRHGATPWTSLRRYQGQTDLSLSHQGRRQAQAVAKRLRRENIDYVFVSALRRARETSAYYEATVKKKARIDARLNEISFGKWEGKTAEEIIRTKDKSYAAWCRGKFIRPPKGEPIKAVSLRTTRFLGDILKKYPRKNIAVFSHGGAIKIMLAHLMNLPLRSLWSFRIEPGSITVLRCHPGFTECLYVNNMEHLGK